MPENTGQTFRSTLDVKARKFAARVVPVLPENATGKQEYELRQQQRFLDLAYKLLTYADMEPCPKGTIRALRGA